MGIIYNIDFEVASFIFMILLYLFVRLYYTRDSEVNTAFRRTIFAAIFANLLDVISAICITYSVDIPNIVNVMASTAYFWVASLVGYLFVKYIYMANAKDKANTAIFILSEFIFGGYVILLLFNMLDGFIFTFNSRSGEYLHGYLYALVYIVPYLLLACALIIVFRAYGQLLASQKISLIVFVGFSLAGPIIQICYCPYTLITVFTLSCGVVLMMFSMETPDYRNLVRTMDKLSRTEERAVLARELAERATRTKSEFLEDMSHEIRVPIDSILRTTELMLAGSLDEQQRSYTKSIGNVAGYLRSIADDISDFSKGENGELIITSEPYDVDAMFNSCYEMTIRLAEVKNLVLELVVDPEIPASLIGDEQHNKQIIVSLINNAIRFTSKGYVNVSAGYKLLSSEQVALVIAFKDTGKGLTKEQRSLIFDAYTDNARYAKASNIVDLGLALTLKYVNTMGGRITADGKPNGGATITVEIPQTKDSQNTKSIAEMRAINGGVRMQTSNERLDIIDFEAGLSGCLGDREFYHEILEVYLGDELGKRMADAFTRGEWNEFIAAAQAMRSNSIPVGALMLSQAAGKIAEKAAGGDEAYVAEHVTEIAEAHASVLSQIAAEIKG